jgi:D-glycero-beta-D-manno-heptose 1-phosphate adenylyltransferase
MPLRPGVARARPANAYSQLPALGPAFALARGSVKQSPATDGCFARCPKAALRARELGGSLPRPLVFTHGVFDLLHAGHVACFEQARELGNSLVVGIHTDASARRLCKARLRPCHAAADRARVVAALAAVSAVVLFDEDKPLALMCVLRPDVFVKRGDHVADRLAETALMAEWGGRTVIVPRLPGLSTTATIQRLSGFGPAVRAR